MDSTQYTFQRYEKKFRLTPEQCRNILSELEDRMEQDEYGKYSICNIYYDTPRYDLIRYSLGKPVYKEKFRLRSYGVPKEEDQVFAEIKKKFNGVVYKRRVDAPLNAIRAFVMEGRPLHKDPQIQREIRWFLDLYRPEPKVFIGYERMALTGKNENLRITFDWNIRWRQDRPDLTEGNEGLSLLPDDSVIMEIKTPFSVPFWLSGLLSSMGIYSVRFSKYGTCYLRYILPQEISKGGHFYA